MTKTTKKKKKRRNPPDSTMRNVRAAQTHIARVERAVRFIGTCCRGSVNATVQAILNGK